MEKSNKKTSVQMYCVVFRRTNRKDVGYKFVSNKIHRLKIKSLIASRILES